MPPKLPTALNKKRGFSGRTRGQSIARRLHEARLDTKSLPAPHQDETGSDGRNSRKPSVGGGVGGGAAAPRSPGQVSAANSSANFLAAETTAGSASFAMQPRTGGGLLGGASKTRQRSLTSVTAPPTAPEEDTVLEDEIEAIFWVRVQEPKSRIPGAAKLESTPTWKRRLVRLCLNHENEEAARLEIYAIQTVHGSEVAVELKDDAMRMSIPLHRLELVQKGQIPANQPLEFLVPDPRTGRSTREYKFGQLMFSLHFSDVDFLKAPLELGCASTDERDAWHDWFTSYIVHCELKAVRTEKEDSYQVAPKFLGEPPAVGVAKFVNTFIAGAKAQKKEDDKPAEPLDIRRPPNKGQVFVRVTDEKFDKRKMSCNSRGKLTLSGGFGVQTEHIDLTTSLVSADTPWGGNFFIRLSTTAVQQLTSVVQKKAPPFDMHEGRIELKTAIAEDRAKVIEWILFCKGIEQTHDETFPYEAKERREAAGDDEKESSDHAVRNSTSGNSHPRAGSSSANAADFLFPGSSQTPDTASSRGDGDAYNFDDVMMVISGTYSRGVSEVGPRLEYLDRPAAPPDPLLALPITDEEEMHLVLGPKEDIPGTWAHVELCAIGGTPVEEAAFGRRLVAFDSVARRVYVVQGAQLGEVVADVHLDDIFAVSGYSVIYGAAGFTLHCRQGVELHVVPESSAVQHVAAQQQHLPHGGNSSEKLRWLTALQHLGVFADGLSREEVNAAWVEEQRAKSKATAEGMAGTNLAAALADVCRLCTLHRSATAICPATGCAHAAFLEQIGQKGTGVEGLLPPRRVMPRSVEEVLLDGERTLNAAQEAMRALHELLEGGGSGGGTPSKHSISPTVSA